MRKSLKNHSCFRGKESVKLEVTITFTLSEEMIEWCRSSFLFILIHDATPQENHS